MRSTRSAAVLACLGLTALVALVALVVSAAGVRTAGAAGRVYGDWSVSGANPSWTGSLAIPAIGFPTASLATNSSTPTTPVSAFLNATTPFGSVFGSSQGSEYLSIAAAPGRAPSTTTITFDGPTPATGWGFALGDVDAEQVRIVASGPGGPLTTEQLGFRGAFNYCTPATPRPSSCGGPQTDTPIWDAGTSTLIASGSASAGASAWFRPTAPLTSLTLTATVLVANQRVQLWAAALTSDVSGAVTVADGTAVPAGTTVRLRTPAGREVASQVVGAGGSFSFRGVVAEPYVVEVVAPAGYEPVGSGTLPADATAGDVTGLRFVLQLVPPTTTTTSTTTSTTTTTTTTTSTTTTEPPTTSTSPTTTTTEAPTTTTEPPTTTTTEPPTTTTTEPPTTSTTTTTEPPTTTTEPPTTTTTEPPTTTTTTSTTTTVPPTTTTTEPPTTTTTEPPTTTSTTSTTTTVPPTSTTSPPVTPPGPTSTTAPPAPRTVVATIDDATAVVGQRLAVTGTGFAPGEVVTATLSSPTRPLGSQPADAAGSVTFAFVVAAADGPGAHTVTLSGPASGNAAVGFEVAAATLPATGRATSSAAVAVALTFTGLALVGLARRRG